MRPLSAVLLAAGASRRLGQPKQLLSHHGETLVRRAARAALEAGVDELVVVVGAEAEAVAAALEGLELRIIEHPQWSEGMGSSIAAGVRAASGASVLVLSADQPAVDAPLLRQLIAGMEAGHARVACAYAGIVGIPALFSSAADLSVLRGLSGDRGARDLLRGDGGDLLSIAAEQAGMDVDDVADWECWRASHPGGDDPSDPTD